MDSKPVFIKENVEYEREEKNGFWTYLSKAHSEAREIIVNGTSKEILSLCDGSRTTKQIEKEMKKRYPDAKFKKIKTDVDSVIASFSRLGIIDWKGVNPFLYRKPEIIENDMSMMIAQEEDISSILEFIENHSERKDADYIYYKSPSVPGDEYAELGLRQKLFFYAEEFFLLVKGNKIIGLMSIGVDKFAGNTVAGLRLIICPKEHLKRLLEYTQDYSPIISVVEYSKVRFLEPLYKEASPELIELLKKEGYQKEGTLKNEFGLDKNVILWAKYYNKSLINKHRSVKKNLFKSLSEKT